MNTSSVPILSLDHQSLLLGWVSERWPKYGIGDSNGIWNPEHGTLDNFPHSLKARLSTNEIFGTKPKGSELMSLERLMGSKRLEHSEHSMGSERLERSGGTLSNFSHPSKAS